MLGENLRNLRRKRDLTQSELSKYLNTSPASIALWETNRRQPDFAMLKNIADFFSVTTDYLLYGKEKKGYKIPVLCSIPAGYPLEAIQDIDDYEEIPESWLLGGKEYFAFKVKGDSMSPKYTNGDIVIMIKQLFYDNGDDCIVYVNGQEATFKRIKTNDKGITLQPLNSDYEPLFFTNEQIESIPIRVIGKAVEIRRKI